MDYRKLVHTAIAKLGEPDVSQIMQHFNALSSAIGQDEAVDILHDAFLLWDSRASTNYAPMLKPVAKHLMGELDKANKTLPHVEENSLLRLKSLIERFHKNLEKCGATIDGKEAVSKDELEKLKITIPQACQAKQQMYSAYASSGYADKLKNGLAFDLK